MPRNGSGTFNLPAGQPVVTGTTISSSTFNALTADLADALTTSVATDGQTAMAANLPMGGHKVTGLAAATGAGEALRYEDLANLQTQAQTQSQTYTYFTTGGTTSAFTLTPTPAITAYAAGQSFFVTFNAANLANATLAISGLASPPNLVKQIADGTFANLAVADVPINHRSRVTLISTTQAWVETLPDVSLGRGQTWQNVTASRALTTTFTNSTGRPITVLVGVTNTTATVFGAAPTVAGVGLPSSVNSTPSSGFIASAAFIVPSGTTYSVVISGNGAGTLQSWFELR